MVAATVEAHTPRALPRSGPGNSEAMSESDVAKRVAAPAPWAARASERKRGLVASPQSTEVSVKKASPTTKTFLRPNRSATAPAVSRTEARVSA